MDVHDGHLESLMEDVNLCQPFGMQARLSTTTGPTQGGAPEFSPRDTLTIQ